MTELISASPGFCSFKSLSSAMSGSASPAARGGGHETNHTCVAHNTSAGAGAGAGAGPSVSAAARTSPDAAGLVRASAKRASHRPPLVGTKVPLRPYRASDVDALVENANDRDVWINLRNLFPHPYTRMTACAYVSTGARFTCSFYPFLVPRG